MLVALFQDVQDDCAEKKAEARGADDADLPQLSPQPATDSQPPGELFLNPGKLTALAAILSVLPAGVKSTVEAITGSCPAPDGGVGATPTPCSLLVSYKMILQYFHIKYFSGIKTLHDILTFSSLTVIQLGLAGYCGDLSSVRT